jgi:uncharacterized circularly permuted ATP-grasp superfamily protein/uncharacterized alpha-E superfamily protein
VDYQQKHLFNKFDNASLVEEIARLSLKFRGSHYNELLGNSPNLLPHWKTFFEQLGSSALNDLDQRMLDLNQKIRDNGISYNVYADENGPQRPWSIDLFPLIIDPNTWQEIESGILQRSRLLEAIISDTYGQQTLLKEGLIPPSLIQGHPGYLREMQGISLKSSKYLHIIAFDLARAPNGKWSVLSQGTQAPSGLGYLLENRNLIARQFPKAYEQMQIAPLMNVYRNLIDSLKLESSAGFNAHIALLTPGPYNETYFEHAYLARYLGLTLVEGGDLTVRNRHLFLKTVRGLELVHILLKRLDDEFLDPLELRADSTLGIPGLLQVIRAGNVILANAPGSGFLESPALLGFLPAISERLLNEKIALPAMDTWWCGEKAALNAAIPNLKNTAIKPTYPRGTGHQEFESSLGVNLSQAQLDEWAMRIAIQPEEHTIQTFIPLAQTPTWTKNLYSNISSIESRSYMLRVFALSNGANSWQILPGGLARIAFDELGITSMQRGGSSADVWVQTNRNQPNLEPLLTVQNTNSAPILRKRLVTSRAAENLYWFGRYTERSENTLRLAQFYLTNINSESNFSISLWCWLEELCKQYGLVPNGVPGNFDQGDIRHRVFERTLISSLNHHENTTSIGYNLLAMKRTASNVRERLAQEQWSTINQSIKEFEKNCQKVTIQNDFSGTLVLDALKDVSIALAAITGAQTDRMTRDDGWQLLMIGRHIERLLFFTNILNSTFTNGLLNNLAIDYSGFTALLNLFDSTITFHAQHQQSREIAPLISLLVFDDENPRSLARVTKALRSRLSKLAGATRGHPDQLSNRVPNLQSYNLQVLSVANQIGQFPELKKCLDDCSLATLNVADEISTKYFNLVYSNKYSVQT